MKVKILALGLFFLITGHSNAFAFPILPSATGWIKDGIPAGTKDGTPDELLFPADMRAYNHASLEVRGISEFDIANIDAIPNSAILKLNFSFAHLHDYPLHLNLYSYSGDGQVSLSDFGLGSFLTSFTIETTTLNPAPDSELVYYTGTLLFDITGILQSLVGQNSSYLGFNLRLQDLDEGLLKHIPGVQATAELDVNPVPEPATVISLLAGMSGLFLRKRRGFSA